MHFVNRGVKKSIKISVKDEKDGVHPGLQGLPRVGRSRRGCLVASEHTNPAGWPRGMESLCLFVTLSEAGVE